MTISQGLRSRQPHTAHQPAQEAHVPQSSAALPSTHADEERLAVAIEAAGMTVPASVALAVGRPLAWMSGQLLWMLEPFIGAGSLGFGKRRGVGTSLTLPGIAHLLEREDAVSNLLERLKSGPAAGSLTQDHAPGAGHGGQD